MTLLDSVPAADALFGFQAAGREANENGSRNMTEPVQPWEPGSNPVRIAVWYDYI